MRLVAVFLAPLLPAAAAVWPDQFAGLEKKSEKITQSAGTPKGDRAVWEEYGLDVIEEAEYAKGGTRLSATAWRLGDSTAAAAAFHWLRAPQGRSWKLDKIVNGGLASASGDAALLAFGNYVLRFEGKRPAEEDILSLSTQLPKLDQAPLPPLLGYLPSNGLAAGSERYILGPASLERFRPGIPPSAAAFHFGAEGLTGRYRGQGGELDLTLFYYPSPQMSRQCAAGMQEIAGAMVKRAGPLVAVILSPHDRDDAERVLAQVNYRATITLSEASPTGHARELTNLILSILALCGVLILFCIASGLMVGGLRVLIRRLAGEKGPGESFTMLHLEDR